jgi:hypothetical protein
MQMNGFEPTVEAGSRPPDEEMKKRWPPNSLADVVERSAILSLADAHPEHYTKV